MPITDRRLCFGAPPPQWSSFGEWKGPPWTDPVPAARRRRPRSAKAVVRPPPPVRLQLPVLLREVQLVGSKHLPKSVVQKALAKHVGNRVSRPTILEALKDVEKWLHDHGYVLSKVAVAQWPSGGNDHTLVIASVEAILTKIRIVGLDENDEIDESVPMRTREETVLRALGLKIGSVFRWRKSSFDRILQLGVFEYAKAELESYGSQNVGIIIAAKEAKSGRFEPGIGISSNGSSHGDISLVDTNFRGKAQRIRAEWQKGMNRTESVGSVEFADPRVGARIPLSYKLRAYKRSSTSMRSDRGQGLEVVNVDGERDRDGVALELGWRPYRFRGFSLSWGPLVELIRPVARGSSSPPDFQLSFTTNAGHDTAETSITPRHGHRISVNTSASTAVPLDVGGRFGGSRSSFLRAVGKAVQYFPIRSSGSVLVGAFFGTGSQQVPMHEQSAIGGPATVRGYKYGELGRSKSYAISRVEVRAPLHIPEDDADRKQEPESSNKNSDGARPKSTRKSAALRAIKAKDGREPQVVVSAAGIDRSDFDEVDEDSSKGMQIPKLPSIVGTIFTDTVLLGAQSGQGTTISYGCGLRIGGFISVEYTWAGSSREPRLHIGLVDASM